jgi:hypothetical protein
LPPTGSRRVAGWVAGITLTYRLEGILDSRCSSFLNKLRSNRRKRGRERIGVTIGRSYYTCYPGRQPDTPKVGGEA